MRLSLDSEQRSQPDGLGQVFVAFALLAITLKGAHPPRRILGRRQYRHQRPPSRAASRARYLACLVSSALYALRSVRISFSMPAISFSTSSRFPGSGLARCESSLSVARSFRL